MPLSLRMRIDPADGKLGCRTREGAFFGRARPEALVTRGVVMRVKPQAWTAVVAVLAYAANMGGIWALTGTDDETVGKTADVAFSGILTQTCPDADVA